MTSQSATTPRDEGRHTVDRPVLPLAAFVFVLVALVVLAVIPAILVQRIADTADEIASELLPAYEQTRDFAFAMEARITLSRSLILTGDPAYGVRLTEAVRAEERALAGIEQFSPLLSPTAAEHVRELLRHAAQRDSLEGAVLAGDGGIETYLEVLPEFDAIRDSMLVQLVGLDEEIGGIMRAQVADEARLAGLQRVISYLLGVLAVLAMVVVGWFGWWQRRTRHVLQFALAEANRQRALAERHGLDLERATEARAHLLRGVTHDIKNPLGAAKGYAELLLLELRAPVAPGQRPLIEGIGRSLDEALSIIADLLDLARADSGGLRVERVECRVAALASDSVVDHRPAAEAAGHTLEAVSSEEALSAFTDPSRVAQVLGNLLSNAIKYTPAPGSITVRTQVESRDDGGRWATIRVDDTGPGIPPELREAIFDEFTRLDDRGPHRGHGLGLAIARRVARLLDGDLTVEEAPSGGASFVFWLPVRRADEGSGA